MKKNIIYAFLLISTVAISQKTKVISGSFENLKGITEYNLVFDYKDLKIDAFATEEDFVKEKAEIIRKNFRKGENPKAPEIFSEGWYSHKEKIFEPYFITSFNKRFEGNVNVAKNLAKAKYTMTVKTSFIHPGCVGCGDHNLPKTNAIITVTENANPNKIVLVFDFNMHKMGDESNGGSFDPWEGKWIGENYAKLAKEFASELKKIIK